MLLAQQSGILVSSFLLAKSDTTSNHKRAGRIYFIYHIKALASLIRCFSKKILKFSWYHENTLEVIDLVVFKN